MIDKKIVLGSDHAGFELKEEIKNTLLELGYDFFDLGTDALCPVDYPDYAKAVAEKVSAGEYGKGILVCGSGVGMAIAANKYPRIRAVQANDIYTAVMSRRHNDTNILALAGRIIGKELSKEIVKAWLETPFDGGRHDKRLEKIGDIEKALYQNRS